MGTSVSKRDEIILQALDPANFPEMRNARLSLVPGRKHPENPVLRPRPGQWDGTRCKVYGTVLFDPRDKLFKMWYSGCTDYPDAVRRVEGATRNVGYAFSEDGSHWERRILGLVEFNGSKNNNLVHLNAQAPSVFLQEWESDPNRRFLMFTEAGLHTYHKKVLYSADGLRWVLSDKLEDDAPQWGKRTHEPFSILYDPEDPDPTRRWKGYSLLHMYENGYRGRAVGLFLAETPERWVEYPTQPIMSAFDGMESEIHLPHVSKFHGLYVMLYDAMEPNHHTQSEIAISYDGIQFQRIQNGVKLLPNSPPGQPDAGKICVSPRAMFVHDDRIWYYYTMSTDTYQTGPRSFYATPWYRYTGLAHWRLEGFACVNAAQEDSIAEITSRQLQIGTGLDAVWLNAVAPSRDPGIVVELLDETGRTLATSRPWSGDRLRGLVTWNAPVPTIALGTRIRLRLHFSGTKTQVYALGVKGAELAEQLSEVPVVLSSSPWRRDVQVRWTFQAEAKISGSPVVHEDKVIFGSWDHHIYALDTKTGNKIWSYETGNAVAASPAIHHDTVYIGSHDGNLYALDVHTGELRWKSTAAGISSTVNGPWIDCTAAVGAWTNPWGDEKEAPHRLFVGAHDREMHALDLKDGHEIWAFPTFNWILSRPAVANYRVYFGSLDGHIYCVDGRCGALHWSYRAGQHLKYARSVIPDSVHCEGVCGSPLVLDGTIYCGADDGFLYALDAEAGVERWHFKTQKWIWGRPVLHEDLLIFGSADGNVYALASESGKLTWRTTLENAVYADLVTWKGEVLVACTSGHLYSLSPKNGAILRVFKAGAGLRAAPVAGPEGTIFLPTCAGTLFTLKP
ncbi:MAG: PQQ-binding-like beta-propeller repeat protein [Candidatus Hydrogenedentes bacterium]|nr:PQQ-binding-like beta-propeller repeat protein [Candidatus Hydrogenedentota bacterium]